MKLETGGMATVYLGYQRGGLGFRQIVAIKRPHAHLLDDPAFRRGFLREANLASKIRHANVVDVRDVDASGQSIDLVMEYVQGASLATLMQACNKHGKAIPVDVVLQIALDACAGLDAAHELTSDQGVALGMVHRDVAPQNILIGEDGVGRVTDFGIAKCVLTGDASTWQGTLKGRLAYMAPEYVSGQPIDRRLDVFALGVLVWEMLAGDRLFRGATDGETMANVLHAEVPPLAKIEEPIGTALHAVLVRALEKEPNRRFRSMRALSDALESLSARSRIVLSHARVAATLREHCGAELKLREAELRDRLEARPSVSPDSRDRLPTSPDRAAARSDDTPTKPASLRGKDIARSVLRPLAPVGGRKRRKLLWIALAVAIASAFAAVAVVLAIRA
jgi:serine/threonine-protein kinase